MRTIELKIGTTMKKVKRCTSASTTENSENSSHSSGWLISPLLTSPEFTSPLRPSSGIQAIMRMTLEVQNGIVQSSDSPICQVFDLTWKARKKATQKPINSVIAQTMKHSLSVMT